MSGVWRFRTKPGDSEEVTLTADEEEPVDIDVSQFNRCEATLIGAGGQSHEDGGAGGPGGRIVASADISDINVLRAWVPFAGRDDFGGWGRFEGGSSDGILGSGTAGAGAGALEDAETGEAIAFVDGGGGGSGSGGLDGGGGGARGGASGSGANDGEGEGFGGDGAEGGEEADGGPGGQELGPLGDEILEEETGGGNGPDEDGEIALLLSDEPEEDDDLETVEVVDTLNPFANKARAKFYDPDTEKPEEFPRYTLIDLDVRVPGVFDYARRFSGFVQDYERDRNETELILLSHDFWIKKTTIRASYEDELISDVLEDLVDRVPALIWNPELIDIENDVEISREWNGQQMDVVLDDIRSISGGDELFGATADREFYFQPLETTSAPRSFGPGEYFATEWEEDGKRQANRAIVRYEVDGEERVVAENDSSAQRELGESIDADGPQSIPIEKDHPEISSEERARDKAQQYLEERRALETGEIDTWEAFAVQPGQLVPVEDPENDIDDEFRVVEVEYEWPASGPETTVTVADKQIDTSDELVALSDDVQRLDLQDSDPDADFLETIEEQTGATLTASASILAREFGDDRVVMGVDEIGSGRKDLGTHITSIDQASTESARVTNAGLNAVRDGWRGEDVDPVTTILVGAGGGSVSRNDTDLEELVDEFPATISLSGMQSVSWSASARFLEETDLSELGIQNAGLYGRVLTETVTAAPLAPVDLSFRIDVETDAGERGVTTRAGGETIRDILAGNDPAIATEMAFGVGDTPPSIDDDALEDEVASAALNFGRTRGTGRTEGIGRLDDETADDEQLAELAQLTNDGTALTRLVFGPVSKLGFEVEANQKMRFSNP